MSGRLLRTILPLAALALAGPARAADDAAQRLLEAVNAARAAAGLVPLASAPPLAVLAAEHSRAMAAAGRLGHAGFAGRYDRARAGLCVENVARGFTQPEAVVQGWLQTDPHRGNLLEPRLDEAGVGIQGPYVTWLACGRR